MRGGYLSERLEELTPLEAGGVFERLMGMLCLGARQGGLSYMRSDLASLCEDLGGGTDSDQVLWLCLLASRHPNLRARFRQERHSNPIFGRLVGAAGSRLERGEEWAATGDLSPADRRLMSKTLF